MLNKIKYSILISGFVFFVNIGNTLAQEKVNPFITIDDGLINNEVTAIKHDRYGFLWFGTRGGLNKYDGYSLKSIGNKNSAINNLNSQAIETLAAGKNNLWIGTKTGGLNGYNFLNDSITSYILPSQGVLNILSIYEDKFENVYVGTTKGLFFKNNKNQIKVVDKKVIASDIISDENGGIWVATNSGLLKFDSKQKLTFNSKFNFKTLNISSLALNSKKKTLFMSTWGKGLLCFNYASGKFINYVNNPNDINSLSYNSTYKVLLEDSNTLWIGTWGGGLNKLNIQTGNFKHYSLSSIDNINYSNKVVLSLEKDVSGIIWVGTEAGIFKLDPQKKKFSNISYQYNNPKSLINANVVSLCKDSNGGLWVGTKDGGLEYTKDFKDFQKIILPYLNDGLQRVNSICEINGKMWIGTLNGFFIVDGINPTDKVTFFTKNNQINGLSGKKVMCITQDKQNNIWLGTQQHGLNRLLKFNANNQPVFKQYLPSENNNGLQSERITCFFNDIKNRLWVGTFNGLHLYNSKKDNFSNYTHVPGDSSSVSNSIILSISQDKDQNIWVGTSNGLNKIIGKGNKITFENYFANDYLPNDYINAILPDNNANIWISTNKGISRLNTRTKKFVNFDVRDGLLSNGFSENAAFKDAEGTLYFSGIKGITYFNPNDIKLNHFSPPVYFTNLVINNKSVHVGETIDGDIPLQKTIFTTKSVTFNYKHVFISLSFAALDYHSPEKIKYSYKLKGFDDYWVNAGRRRSVTYTNLSPGNYTLQVKSTNSDSIWSNAVSEIEFKVLPPPWKTWWAYTIYLTIFLLLLWFSRHVGLNRLRLKNKLEIANISLKKEKDITEIKSTLFSNISHEFRTPLTLMLGPLEDLSKSEEISFGVRKGILGVQEQAKRLYNLVNQLLDFQKSEFDDLILNFQNTDIVSFSKNVCYSFRNEAKRKGITLEFVSSHPEILVNFDEDRMTAILYNLLSNAFKFSNENGLIKLEINQITTLNQSYCEIIVSDTGRGISEYELDKIFNRYYQVKKAEAGKFTGTGIGLAFTKDLVLLHNGTIRAESKPNEGSSFHVILPLGQIVQYDKAIDPINFNETPIYPTENPETFQEELSTSEEKPILLIVDDNVEVSDYLTSLLANIYNIFTAADGLDGLAQATDLIPDIVISDVMMPNMDGYEFCHLLKSDLRTSHIPVILLTAKSDNQSQIKGIKEGADAYLLKPFVPEMLLSYVKTLLESRKRLKEIFIKKLQLGPSEVEITSFEGDFIKILTQKIEENISNPEFQTDDLAEKMNMSRSTFYRKLKAITNMSGSEFLRFIRVKRGAQLLLTNEFSIKQIAYEVGFNYVKHFRKCFIKQYNMTPSEYIKNQNINE
jgi:signal transduction histidine kinase/ligand-binding sensor domain-containing protein/DNA-binding response OmpR family regulator